MIRESNFRNPAAWARGRPPAGRFLAGLVLALLLAGTGTAGAVTLDLGTAAGQVGDTVLLPIDLSGIGGDVIYSCDFEITWSGAYAQFAGVQTPGTLSDGWMVITDGGYGTASVAAAGIVPITTNGTLVYLRFLLGPSAGSPYVYFGTTYLNEGDPVPTLDYGRLEVSAVPTINVGPDSGLLTVGDTLDFNTTGGTPPYTYTASDPAVAGFTGSTMTALAPGVVQVTSQDSGGLSDTTTGSFEVRPFRIEVADYAGTAGVLLQFPVVLDDPTGFGVVSAEFNLSFTAGALVYAGFETAGTLMGVAGWSDPQVHVQDGRVTFAAAGTLPLTGSGALLYVRFQVNSSTSVTPSPGWFNEQYQATPEAAYFSISAEPVIGVSPSSAQLLVGETQVFSAYGSVTPPVTWSVDNPALAEIDASGRLRGLDEGVVRVRAEDSVGVVGFSGDVTICHVGLPALSSSIGASQIVLIPVRANRVLDGLGIYSLEVGVSYDPNRATFLTATTSGTVADAWGMPTVNAQLGAVSIYMAGAQPLEGCEPALINLVFQGDPGLVSPYTGVYLTSALINEGSPCVMINRGTGCSGGSPAPLPPVRGLVLENHPNPFNPRTTIRFRTPTDGPAELSVYTARGEHVRTLWSGLATADVERTVVWDGSDEQGRRQASGVYTARLLAAGQSQLTKMVLLK